MYNIKHYDYKMNYKDTINPNKIVDIGWFRSQWNGGLWNMNLQLNLWIINDDFEVSDIIYIYYKWKHIYGGNILDITKLYWPKIETLSLEIVGFASLLSQYIINQTYNDTASNIMKDIINKANTEYWYNIFSYDSNTIPDSTDNINIEFENEDYLRSLRSLSEVSGLDFFINESWVVYFIETGDNHTLTLRKDVDSLEIKEEGRNITNSLIVDYEWWIETYEEGSSINLYSKRQKYKSKRKIKDLSTVNEFGNNFLEENAFKKDKITLIVNDRFDYFNIKPTDNIRVRNSPFIIDDLKVKGVIFWYETATIELGRRYSFSEEILNN